jgi:peroxiredoxin
MTHRSPAPTRAVPFALTDSRGHTHTLTDYEGHWLLLVFHRHLG